MKVKQLIQDNNYHFGGQGNTYVFLGSESVTDDGAGTYAWLCPTSSEGITVSLEVSAFLFRESGQDTRDRMVKAIGLNVRMRQ